jgi:hypothetical protein
MAKRQHAVCVLPESEPLWRAGRGFVVRDLAHDDGRARRLWATTEIGKMICKCFFIAILCGQLRCL